MAEFYKELLARSWQAFVAAFGNTTLGFIVPVIVVPCVGAILVFFVTLCREGWGGTVSHLGKTFTIAAIVAICGEILVYGSIYGHSVLRTEYEDHKGLVIRVNKLDSENSHMVDPSDRDSTIADLNQKLRESQSQLESRKQTLHNNDPSFQNMTNTIRAFMTWRQTIGYGTPCKMLITSPDGYDDMYMTFTTMAVFGSNCGNGDLNNVGVKRQNIETETTKGMIPGVIVFHALPDAKGANQLETELGNLFQVKRSYAIPGDAPPDAIWLQFGNGVEWNTERFAKTK